MRLLAVSDLHVRHAENRDAFKQLADHRDDWLILGGDICEAPDELAFVLELATRRFARVLWVPGNHELWTTSRTQRRGEGKYQDMVDVCRAHSTLTPEDPFTLWPGPGGPHVLALLFLLYDYSFRPASVGLSGAVEWARESGVVCADEMYLHPDPYASRQAWCAVRCAEARLRLDQATRDTPSILINHFPMRRELAQVPLYPRFSLWCGTTETEDWHRRYRASVVVTGHLHMPSTRWVEGVRFEEVSFGYPNQRRRQAGGIEESLREILPGPPVHTHA